jgi:hypothetical protein
MVTKKTSKRINPWVWVAAFLLIVILSALWCTKAHNSPKNVFWGMLDNNLATQSVTRHNLQSGQGQSLDQYSRLLLGSENAVQTVETRKQSDGAATSTIVHEIIGTPTVDYARFSSINTGAKGADGKPLDYSSVINVWGKTDDPKSGQPLTAQKFNQAVLGTVPFASFTSGQRQQLLDLIQTKNVYNVDFKKVTTKRESGKTAYVYQVQINPQPYFGMLQQFVKMLGITDVSGLDPSRYQGVEPLKVEFTVAKTSRQLLKIHYSSTNQDELYTSYGLTSKIDLPAKTIPVSELENRIQNLQ